MLGISNIRDRVTGTSSSAVSATGDGVTETVQTSTGRGRAGERPATPCTAESRDAPRVDRAAAGARGVAGARPDGGDGVARGGGGAARVRPNGAEAEGAEEAGGVGTPPLSASPRSSASCRANSPFLCSRRSNSKVSPRSSIRNGDAASSPMAAASTGRAALP